MAAYNFIRVGDRTYGLQTSSPEALHYFSRAYRACVGSSLEETGRYDLHRQGGDWRVTSDGESFVRGSLRHAVRQLDWELTRRAVKQDSDCAAFHAAWVGRGRLAVMLAGEGGSGKSRLCLQLLERGFRCGAEDVTFMKGPRLIPFPRAIQLRVDDHMLDHVDPSRVFAGYDGRVCVEVGDSDASSEMQVSNLVIVFLDLALICGSREPLAPLEGLKRLFELCHRLDRVTQGLFDSLVHLATSGRMFVLPRCNAVDTILELLEC